jgi:hypothetical protein
MNTDNDLLKNKDELLQKGNLFGYIPKHLSEEWGEGVFLLPLNVLFTKFRKETNGITTMGSALYLPELSALVDTKKELAMTYYNQYDKESYLIIKIMIGNPMSYEAEKFVKNISVGITKGKIDNDEGWTMFFTHLTLQGLTNGEACKFDYIKE